MGNTKHTKGPWKVDFNREIRQDLGESRGFPICMPQGLNDADQMANAHLIAAAPDLLEALERIALSLPELLDENNDEPLSGADVIDILTTEGRNIKQVIAKAKGES